MVNSPKPLNFKLEAVLLCLATTISCYLTFQSMSGSQIAGCGEGAGCQSVLNSKWSSVLNIPISTLGITLYLNLIFCILFCIKYAAQLSTILASCIILGALWFTVLQAFVLKQFCFYCCSVHFLATIASALILKKLYKKNEALSTRGFFITTGIAIPITSCVILLQTFGPQKERSRINTIESGSSQKDQILISTTEINELTLLGGTYLPPTSTLESESIGPSGGKVTHLVYLYDWTCEHCRALHQMLHQLDEVNSPYQITYLPAYHDQIGEQVHHLMLSARFTDEFLHQILSEELYAGITQPTFDAISASIGNNIDVKAWNTLRVESNEKVKLNLKIGQQQQQYTSTKIGSETLPQLLSTHSSLSGSPSEKQLLDFLNLAKREQSNTITNSISPSSELPR